MTRSSCPRMHAERRLRALVTLSVLAICLGVPTLATTQTGTVPTSPSPSAAPSPTEAAPAPRAPDATTPAQPRTSKSAQGPQGRRAIAPPPPAKLVDINSAGRAELMTLPGISAADADRIIAKRPYLTKAELVTKKVLGEGPYVSVRHHVVAVQKNPPKASKPAAAASSRPASKP